MYQILNIGNFPYKIFHIKEQIETNEWKILRFLKFFSLLLKGIDPLIIIATLQKQIFTYWETTSENICTDTDADKFT